MTPAELQQLLITRAGRARHHRRADLARVPVPDLTGRPAPVAQQLGGAPGFDPATIAGRTHTAYET